ncbi:MAG: exodeoxyribonuclease VII small subunit [Acidobacteriota bacterium]|jgi:exodeoxyribonuclease VII small subunit
MSPTKKKKEAAELPFEEAIARLEGIVEELEAGEVPLERSLELFEEGVRLSRGCLGRLDAAERRIELLLHDEETGEDRAVPFAAGEEE